MRIDFMIHLYILTYNIVLTIKDDLVFSDIKSIIHWGKEEIINHFIINKKGEFKLKKWKTRCIFLLMLVMVISSINFCWASDTDSATTVFSGKKIAIYSEAGADSRTISALCSAFSRMGHYPMAVTSADLEYNRITTTNFDILVFPAGEQGTEVNYLYYLNGKESKIRNFVSAGGGVIGIEAGARLLCDTVNWNNIVTNQNIDLYAGQCIGPLIDIGQGMAQIKITNSNLGTVGSIYTTYIACGATCFTTAPGATVFAEYTGVNNLNAQPAIVGIPYGSGYVCLIGPELEMEEKSELDLAVWDNLENSFFDPETELPLLAKLVEYADGGSILNQTTISTTQSLGKRVAVYSSHDINGGAWPAFLPAVFKSVKNAGHKPIAITAADIWNDRLTTSNFDAVIFPGGYSYGYFTQLYGAEQKIRDFVNDGGGCMGICAGSFYLSNTVKWEGISYNYPVDLFSGIAEGPLSDICGYPGRELIPIQVNDQELGINTTFTTTYYGGPYFHSYGGQTITNSSIYTYGGAYNNTPAIIRFNYGDGKVVLSGPHPEIEEGYTNDWCFWDNYKFGSTVAQTDPDSEWGYIDACLDLITSNQTSNYFQSDGTKLGIIKTNKDNILDGMGDAQRKDTITNPPSAPTYVDGWYTVGQNKVMELTGFGAGVSVTGTLDSITLKVRFSVDANSTASNKIQWSTDGITYHDTTIQPTAGDQNKEVTFNLKSAGVDTMSEMQNLRIYYKNNSTVNKNTSFDYVHVKVIQTGQIVIVDPPNNL